MTRMILQSNARPTGVGAGDSTRAPTHPQTQGANASNALGTATDTYPTPQTMVDPIPKARPAVPATPPAVSQSAVAAIGPGEGERPRFKVLQAVRPLQSSSEVQQPQAARTHQPTP